MSDDGCPRLCCAMQEALKVTLEDDQRAGMLAEGLFAHFFCSSRKYYHPQDIHWFLKLVNSQTSSEKDSDVCEVNNGNN